MSKRAIAVIGLSTFGTALVRQLANCGCRILAALDLRGRFRLLVLATRDTDADTVHVNPDPTSPVTPGTELIVCGRHDDIDRMLEQ